MGYDAYMSYDAYDMDPEYVIEVCGAAVNAYIEDLLEAEHTKENILPKGLEWHGMVINPRSATVGAQDPPPSSVPILQQPVAMHPHVGCFAILAVIMQLSQLSLGAWTPGKAAQINFYTGDSNDCGEYNGEATCWWTSSPLVGTSGNTTAAECFRLSMPGNTTGINITMMWGETTTSDTAEPAQATGWCTVWDDQCTGHEGSVAYTPTGWEEPPGGSLSVEKREMLHRHNNHHPSFDSSLVGFGFDYYHLGCLSLNAATTNQSYPNKIPLLLYNRRGYNWCCFIRCGRHPTGLSYQAPRSRNTGDDSPIPDDVETTRSRGTERVLSASNFGEINEERGEHAARPSATLCDFGGNGLATIL
ncbi:hypothetical protein MSAN_00974300 [Mycena sanguinolenta]|uniref:Uncharacterized protein n=1 Tax=Mycena sanguinolenta TaxID=230812 RepID=A0A8H6YZI7_9AGAR|nr:hypothetical protein MSAN_00974300 [Mycena sanguinolenta]